MLRLIVATSVALESVLDAPLPTLSRTMEGETVTTAQSRDLVEVLTVDLLPSLLRTRLVVRMEILY